MDIDEERHHMQEAIRIHTEVTGKRPTGWYTGRCSPNTEQLVVEEGGFLYHADSYLRDIRIHPLPPPAVRYLDCNVRYTNL